MAGVTPIALCCIYLLLLEPASSLKCRTGVQEMDDQFRKVVQSCRKRYADNNDYGNDSSSSNENDHNEHSSNIDVLDKFFKSNRTNPFPNAHSWKEQNNWNHGIDRIRNGNEQRYSFNYTDENWKDVHYRNRDNNNYNLGYFDGAVTSDYDQSYDSNSGIYKEQKQSCVIQCLFDELNMVDHKGFPRQESVIQLMTHNIQNPELQDFMKEAIVECFYYLGLDAKQDKCYFSQNILSCLDDKSKERCEDWDN